MIWNLISVWIMFFFVSFCNIIKVNHFLYSFIILPHFISSFSLTISSLAPYAYVSVKPILSVCSVNSFCFSLLNLCFAFVIDLLFFMNSLSSCLQQNNLSTLILFFLYNFFYYQAELLLNSFSNFYFHDTLFCAFCFFYLHYHH